MGTSLSRPCFSMMRSEDGTTCLAELKRKTALGCVLIGDPTYYGQFGFSGNGRLSYRDLPREIVQWVAFGEAMPARVLQFSPGPETAAI